MKLKDIVLPIGIEEFIDSSSFKETKYLTEIQKRVVRLYFKEKMNMNKIALYINRSNQLVKVILQRAIQLIGFILTPKTPDTLIKDSVLSARIKHTFSNNDDFKYLKDFDKVSVESLLRRNLGIRSAIEIDTYIKDLGFSLIFPEKHRYAFQGKFKRKYFEDSSDEEILNFIINLTKFMKDRGNRE